MLFPFSQSTVAQVIGDCQASSLGSFPDSFIHTGRHPQGDDLTLFYSLHCSSFSPSGAGYGAAPRNCARRIAGRDACPPRREESVSTAPAAPSPDGWSTAAGAIGTISPAPSKSTLSARFTSITRLPLLRRTTAAIPFFLRASTLCRISLGIFWALPLQSYQCRSFWRAPWECR